MSDPIRLIGDIGGTNARFAFAGADEGYFNERVFRCADYATAADAIREYLADLGEAPPEVICIAAAGPVIDGVCRFTNSSWEISERALAAEFGAASVVLINDFSAVSFGLPALREDFCLNVGSVPAPSLGADFTLGVLGPGTGLGVAGLLSRNGSWSTLVSEGGHIGFAPETRVQRQVLEALAGRFSRVSVERLLSGAGVENLYLAVCQIIGAPVEARTAEAVFAAAQSQQDAAAQQTAELFFEILGQVAGDIALAFGAQDGMFIAGGIVQRYPEMLQASGFRAAFERKGRHSMLLESVPTLLIEHAHPGLFGAAVRARQTLSDAHA